MLDRIGLDDWLNGELPDTGHAMDLARDCFIRTVAAHSGEGFIPVLRGIMAFAKDESHTYRASLLPDLKGTVEQSPVDFEAVCRTFSAVFC